MLTLLYISSSIVDVVDIVDGSDGVAEELAHVGVEDWIVRKLSVT